MSLCLSIHLSIFLSFCIYVNLFLRIFVYLSTFLPIYLSTCLNCLLFFLSKWLTVSLSSFLTDKLSVYMSICLPVKKNVHFTGVQEYKNIFCLKTPVFNKYYINISWSISIRIFWRIYMKKNNGETFLKKNTRQKKLL